ncbi:trigger factor-related chaperone [Mycoplasmopsis columbinasalis]|uniref:Trigger factor n=1 Tax=Mycoplasmopsis columbinasalis TaxID=114880 RepID=A0A449BB15_9BACT|nr:hypothetical protein [Mycoplasmopsis columbinasalis]VEU78374.1 Uncharacterised protein [Mycoplasmopsis columbinasalis]
MLDLKEPEFTKKIPVQQDSFQWTYEQTAWQKTQTDVITELIKHKQKVTSEQPFRLAAKAASLTFQDAFVREVVKPSANEFSILNFRVIDPIKITKEEYTNALMYGKISFKDWEKYFDWKNINVPFKVRPHEPYDFVVDSAEKFLKNYPLFLDIKPEDEIQLEDNVELLLNVFSPKKEVLEENKLIKIVAQKFPNPSLNETVIGKKVGQEYSVNDPDNNHLKIVIVNAKRKQNVELTETLCQQHFPEFGSLENYKNTLVNDFLTENAVNLLTEHWVNLLDYLGGQVYFDIADTPYRKILFENEIQWHKDHVPLVGELLKDYETLSFVDKSDEKSQQLKFMLATFNKPIIKHLLFDLIEKDTPEFELSDEEKENFLQWFVRVSQDDPFSPEMQARLEDTLRFVRVAMYSAKYNEPELYYELKHYLKWKAFQ